MRARRGNLLEQHQLWLAPAGSLLLLLMFFLVIRPKAGVDYCACGAELGPQLAPFVRGPDELPRAPFLDWHHREKLVMLDSTEVSSADGLVDEKRLGEELELRRELWRANHPGGSHPDALIVRAPRKLPATGLQTTVAAACSAGLARLVLATRPLAARYYRGINLELDCLSSGRGSDASRPPLAKALGAGSAAAPLHLPDFLTVDDLARHAARLRAAKTSVVLSSSSGLPELVRGARAASAR